MSSVVLAQTDPLPEFEQLQPGLTGVSSSSVAWGDYDNDGDLDILLTGNGALDGNRIYRNDAGTFVDINPQFLGVPSPSVAWGDYDGDGDLDILLTGKDLAGRTISNIYKNIDGIFTDINAGLRLEGVSDSSVAWGDYDGDGDLDILLTGRSSSGPPISKIYRNNGADSFTDINAGLEGVLYSAVAWGDYDGDGDLDILLTGLSLTIANSFQPISRIYRNDAGSFTDIVAGLEEVGYSSVAWGDYDEDGDLDILLSGRASRVDPITGVNLNYPISRIYRNDAGTFTDINAGLEGVSDSSVAWGDYDGDGDLDILLTGRSSSGAPISKIYRNDAGTFNPIDAGLEGVYWSSVAWGDYDGDGDLDILLTGQISSGRISTIYRNNSVENGQIYEAPTAPGNLISSVDNLKKQVTLTWDAATDNTTNPKSLSYNVYLRVLGESGYLTSPQALESDGWRLVPGLGNGQLGTSYTWNYSNEDLEKTFEWRVQAIDNSFAGGLFSEASSFVTPIPEFEKLAQVLEGVVGSSVAWGDYDGDGDLDFLITGQISGGQPISKIYRNNGTDSFEDINAGLEGVAGSSVAWGDYDGDGDLDILLTGNNSSDQLISSIYQNNGDETFTDILADLEGVSSSSVAWGDYDGDGDLDILLTGKISSTELISRIYRNDAGIFTDIEAGLIGVRQSSAIWGDYDGDGDLDILLTGNSSNARRTFAGISRIYRNDAGIFTDIEAGLEGVSLSSVAWGDYDGDGDLDILLTGQNSSAQLLSRIYKNTAGTFTDILAGLEGVSRSSVAWGDYDGDGDLDILLTGSNSSDQLLSRSRIYRNDEGAFTDIDAGLEEVYSSSVAWGDYDGDGDLDILLTGAYSSTQYFSSIYRNNSVETEQSYQAPTAPSNLDSSVDLDKKQVTLTWDAATDNTTNPNSLSYNVYLRVQGASGYLTSPQALESDGWRLVPGLGNGQLGTSYTWNYSDADAEKTFEWKVQAIDNSFVGGEFSEANTFKIGAGIISISGSFEALDKTYDAEESATIATSALVIDGLLPDAQDVTIASIEIRFADKDTGDDKLVSIFDITLSGSDAGFYTLDLTGSPTTAATISALSLAVTGLTADDKEYDGLTDATLNGTPSVTGLGSEDVSIGGTLVANFAQSDVGSAIAVTVSGLALDGADKANYEILQPIGLAAIITKRDITITVDAGQSKYCGQIDPDFTYTFSEPLLPDNLITGALSRTTLDESVKIYAYTDGDLSAGTNYSLTLAGTNTFEIKGLTIDASASGTPVQIGTSSNLSATVSSGVAGINVTFVLTNEAGITIFTSDPVVTNSSGIATVSTVELNTIGVYKGTATAGSGCTSSIAYIPVFDPDGNFVTGAGWIDSPAGAYKADESLTGKANFGFVSKYKKGSNQVDGKTDFQFKAADLNFKSTLHESGTLVISGKKATYRGEGTINDVPGFRFTLVALDGDWNGETKPDEFRIKIWGSSGVIYDNGMGLDDNSDAAATLGGGSIVIREAKDNSNKRVVSDLVAVPWNTPSEEIEKKIASMSSDWFEGKAIKLTINTASYNPLAAGFYEMKVDVQGNEWFALEEPITVNVLVADKPLATDIQLSNSILLRNIHNGSLIGDLSTIDPVDDQHTYTIAEHANFELVGQSLIWKGAEIPATARITVFSMDRAGQTIERVIELSREPRFGDFIMFPNPASSELNLEVELEQSMNVGIRIYDAIGRLVYQEEGVQNGIATYQIAIDQLSPGLYTVQMKTGILVMNKILIKK